MLRKMNITHLNPKQSSLAGFALLLRANLNILLDFTRRLVILMSMSMSPSSTSGPCFRLVYVMVHAAKVQAQ